MKKSKKGILMPEILRIIVAVACIFLLVYLAVKLYGIFTLKGDLEKARAELANIGGKIDAVEKDADSNAAGKASAEYLLLSPQEWALTGWPYQSSSGPVNVQYCTSHGWASCLCMCNTKTTLLGVETPFNKMKPSSIAESCNADGVCIEIKAGKLKVNPIDPVKVLWGLYEFGGSDVAPIYIKNLNEDFQGDLNIAYDKTTKELSIIPFKK